MVRPDTRSSLPSPEHDTDWLFQRHINDIHHRSKKFYCPLHSCAYSKTGGRSFPRKDSECCRCRRRGGWSVLTHTLSLDLRRHLVNIHQMAPELESESEPGPTDPDTLMEEQ